MMHDGACVMGYESSDFYCTESFSTSGERLDHSHSLALLERGVIDLEDLILNYNQVLSGERVIGVKKRENRRRSEDSSQLCTIPSAHHNSSPLLEVNVARRKDRQERSMLPGRRNKPGREEMVACLRR